MPVRQNNKITTSVADVENVKDYQDSGLRRAAIFVVNSNKTVDGNSLGRFLINPASWTENLASNWAIQQTPGQSSPPMQWVSGGPRTVSFQALVTQDTSQFSNTTKALASSKTSTFSENSLFGAIAGAFSKVSAPPPRTASNVSEPKLDISDYLNYYRSLLYPSYNGLDKPTTLLKSPPLVVLYVGNSIPKFPVGNTLISSQTDLWVVTNLEINITKQLNNLAPMEATVNFQLTQYNIRSFDRSRFLNGIEPF